MPRSECVCSQESFYVAFEEKEKKPAKSLHLISIQHVQQPSTSTHTTIRSCRVGSFDPTTLLEIAVSLEYKLAYSYHLFIIYHFAAVIL